MQLSIITSLRNHGLHLRQFLDSLFKLHQLYCYRLLVGSFVITIFFILRVDGGHLSLLLFCFCLRENGLNLDVGPSHGHKVQVKVGVTEDLLVRLGPLLTYDRYSFRIFCLFTLVLIGFNFCVGVKGTQIWLLPIQDFDYDL